VALQNHILFVEAHADTRELVSLVLASLKCRVTTSTSCTDGLKLAQHHKFDLYLLNSWLPDGSGVELCKKLRELNPGIPIVFLSAAAFENDKQTAINSGAQRYLVKPIDIDVLGSEMIALIHSETKKQKGLAAAGKSLTATVAGGEPGIRPHVTIMQANNLASPLLAKPPVTVSLDQSDAV